MQNHQHQALLLILIILIPITIYFTFKSLSRPVFHSLPFQNRFIGGDSVLCQYPNLTFSKGDGSTLDLASLTGKISVVSFVNPNLDSLRSKVIVGNMQEIQKNIRDAGYIQLLTVFTGDSLCQEMHAYIAKKALSKERWHFVCDDPAKQDSLFLSIGLKEEDRLSGVENAFIATKIALIDKQGRVRKYYIGTDPMSIRKVNEDLRALTVLEYREELK